MKNLSTDDWFDHFPHATAAHDRWADGETQAFIERPYHAALPIRVLGVAVCLAAAVAVANIVWIFANLI